MKKCTCRLKTIFLWILVVNSLIYGSIVSYTKLENFLWDISHYVVYAVFIFLLSCWYDNVKNKNIPLFLLECVSPLISIFFGYNISTLDFMSLKFILIISLQLLFAIISILLCFKSNKLEKKERAFSESTILSANQVARIVLNNENKKIKMLFKVSVLIMFCCFILFAMLLCVGDVKRIDNVITTFKIFFVLQILFVILEFAKQRCYKKAPTSQLIFEILIAVVCFNSCFYLNGVVYHNSEDHYFITWILPAVGCTPFLLSSMNILNEYIDSIRKK